VPAKGKVVIKQELRPIPERALFFLPGLRARNFCRLEAQYPGLYAVEAAVVESPGEKFENTSLMDQLLALAGDPSAWLALVTLAAMEIVLGVDNLVIIALLSSKLPPKEAAKARQIGLGFSLLLRLLLLSGAAYAIRLTAPLFAIFAHSFSFRDVMFAAGGLFLVLKATIEIHHATDPRERAGPETGRRSAFPLTAGQIVFFDLIFSIDSIITAVGMTEQIPIMFGAVIIAVLVMLLASGPIARFIRRNPAIVILALGFLLLIGTALIADGFGFHLPRGYIYAAMAFSAFIESLHMLARKRSMMRAGFEHSRAESAGKKPTSAPE
jgi:predicted tellurium resistance membrane protein TerC